MHICTWCKGAAKVTCCWHCCALLSRLELPPSFIDGGVRGGWLTRKPVIYLRPWHAQTWSSETPVTQPEQRITWPVPASTGCILPCLLACLLLINASMKQPTNWSLNKPESCWQCCAVHQQKPVAELLLHLYLPAHATVAGKLLRLLSAYLLRGTSGS